MHIGEKLDALQAELAAKSSRIADLEARVSLLETENARLRKKFMPEGDAMDRTGGRVVNDAMEVGDGDGEGGSDDKVEIMDAYGGHHGSVRCDAIVGLDDDDVSITPRGKKRAAARVISDSESGEEGDGESGEEDENDGGNGDREVGFASSRKRALRGVTNSESEEEEEDGEPYEMEGCSTPAPRRSARLVKSQSKRTPPARRELEFEEPQDHEETEDGSESEEGYNTDEFIDDADCSDNPPDPAEEYSAELEECDSDEDLNYGEIIDRIRGKKNATNNDWKNEAEMLPAFDVDPELTLKAICAIYRQQTEDEQAERATIVHNRRGFSQIDAPRGSRVAQFLLDGDASGPLKKTAQDLNKFDREFCHKMAFRYSKQLFEIYQNKEDPYFP